MRRSGWTLDWTRKPPLFKEHPGLDPEPPPAQLERILRLGAGARGPRFRTYSSAGALYPIEIYVASRDGLFHFHARELALRRLRGEDVRGNLGADGTWALPLTGILWRTAWKYRERGYRHLYWDAGTMLANLLAVGGEARVLTGFVDAVVNEALGADGVHEAAVVLLVLGHDDLPPPATIGPSDVPALDGSRLPDVHASTTLADDDAVRRYRAGHEAIPSRGRTYDDGVFRRRGSTRDYALEPLLQDVFAAIVDEATATIPLDVPTSNEVYAIVHAVEGLEPGVYRGLELVRAGSFRREAAFLALEQPFVGEAAATLFFMATVEPDRRYRAAQLEAGIRTGRVYLAAEARGLGASAFTFYDDAVSLFLGTDAAPMLGVAVGYPARSSRAARRA